MILDTAHYIFGTYLAVAVGFIVWFRNRCTEQPYLGRISVLRDMSEGLWPVMLVGLCLGALIMGLLWPAAWPLLLWARKHDNKQVP